MDFAYDRTIDVRCLRTTEVLRHVLRVGRVRVRRQRDAERRLRQRELVDDNASRSDAAD